ncbi:hypothetical protein SYNTR_1553 [Candidatus Syntrophocurvum alkaliphilum]|uniref:ClpX-type ZB domain-containing protein n=1 Tax=Candidatus Syntrophocurvum alkaliphilum TaxID=2293317 RepID=A0A6I6DGB8_9FIRM|nr:hypothetical protein [Candidatus Syntrophocurvum alkaliphilum]QGU00147.1 hypothetical protein SYNTR_1553 [Candidatus Syntrophocurvum alkaliphilum]
MDNSYKCRQCSNLIDEEQLTELSQHGLDMCIECAEQMIIYQYWG